MHICPYHQHQMLEKVKCFGPGNPDDTIVVFMAEGYQSSPKLLDWMRERFAALGFVNILVLPSCMDIAELTLKQKRRLMQMWRDEGVETYDATPPS